MRATGTSSFPPLSHKDIYSLISKINITSRMENVDRLLSCRFTEPISTAREQLHGRGNADPRTEK
jgi:hypothetical protein